MSTDVVVGSNEDADRVGHGGETEQLDDLRDEVEGFDTDEKTKGTL